MASDNDDQLDPAEVEALLNSAGGGPAAGGPGKTAVPAAAAKPVPGSEIDALLRDRSRGGPTTANPEALLERAAADLAAAVAPDVKGLGHRPDPVVGATPFEFRPFDEIGIAGVSGELGSLKDVELDLRIELGRTELLIEEVLKLREGSVVALDKLAGDPVDILVNGRLIARGEVLVLNDNFCVRIAEILAPALE